MSRAGICDAITAGMRKYLACILLITACGDSDDNDERDQAFDEGDARGQALAAQARGDLDGESQPEVAAKAAGIVHTINTGEIAQADFMLSATTDDDVRELANAIRADHQANDAELQAMMQDLRLVPVDNPVSLMLRDEAMAGLATLQAMPAEDRDFEYARMQVSMHQTASLVVETTSDLVDDTELRAFLDRTVDAINEHRDQAGDVLDDL
jgi:predicted outer membrane protein